MEQRRSYRHQARLRICLEAESVGRVECYTTDCSYRGMRFVSQQNWRVGEKATAQIYLDVKTSVTVEIAIMLEFKRIEEGFVFGAEFLRFAGADAFVWQNSVQHLAQAKMERIAQNFRDLALLK